MKREQREEPAKEPFKHKKSLGQNFLTSDVVPNWMCDAARLEPGEVVLEIGPGTGRLTKELLKRGATVIAIEPDPRAIISLEETFSAEIASSQLILKLGDAREITPKTLNLKTGEFKVVSNIPYYLSGILLRGLLDNDTQPSVLVFLMQKELVERIARTKKSSLLSLSVAAFGQPSYIRSVSRGHFFPKPNVDSAILLVANINRENFATLAPEAFFDLLHLGLGKKRKQLITNLSENWPRESLERVFNNLALSLTVRGEDLNLREWLKLAQALLALPKTD